MMKLPLFADVATQVGRAERIYGISPVVKNILLVAPVVVVLIQAISWLHPVTRELSRWMLRENHPVELLTFVFLLAAAGVGSALAVESRNSRDESLAYGFYGIFSLLLVLVALEEIAWGQWLFGFATPDYWAAINAQGETTLHNIGFLQGHSELLRLVYGLGGLIGVGLCVYPVFQRIAVPALLLPWFLVIVAHASVDVFNDIVPIQIQFDRMMQRTSELIELLIAVSAFLYVRLNMQRIKCRMK